MPVAYRGLNQLGEEGSGFFTFTAVRPSPTTTVHIIVTPPPSSGFRLFCTRISPLALIRMPECTSGGVDAALNLKFETGVQADQAYTFGIHVYNPGGKPLASNNYWGLTLMDHTMQTFDGNLRIPGLELKSIPMRCNGIGWTSAAARVLNTLLVQLKIMQPIPAGTANRLVVMAPNGVMFSESESAVRVVPIPLPLEDARPTRVAGDLLIFNLDTNADIRMGIYNIRFEVSNPSVYSSDNTWSIRLEKDIEVLFSFVAAGYVQGQESPLDLGKIGSVTSAAQHRAGCLLQAAVMPAGALAFSLLSAFRQVALQLFF